MKINLTPKEVKMVLNAINNVPEYSSHWDNLAGKIQQQTKRR